MESFTSFPSYLVYTKFTHGNLVCTKFTHGLHPLFLGAHFEFLGQYSTLTIACDTRGARGNMSVERLDQLESLERLIKLYANMIKTLCKHFLVEHKHGASWV